MVVDYLSSQLDWAGYQVSTKWGSGPSPTGLDIRHSPNRGQNLTRFTSTTTLVVYRSAKWETETVTKLRLVLIVFR